MTSQYLNRGVFELTMAMRMPRQSLNGDFFCDDDGHLGTALSVRKLSFIGNGSDPHFL